MTMYSTARVNTGKTKLGQFIGYGISLLRINSLEVQKARTSDSKRIVFHMETEAVDIPGFEGADGAKGQVGRVMTIYMNNKEREEEFQAMAAVIAEELGVRKEVDQISATTLEEFVDQLNKLITGKFAWFVVTAEEYARTGRKPGIVLHFARFNFVASKERGPDSLTFDKSKHYHYKAIAVPSTENELSDRVAEAIDDLPL